MGFFSDLAGQFFGAGGASIGHNTAYIKSVWVKVRRAPRGMAFSSTITVNGMELANPAAIVYECLTNVEWGMGAPSSSLDQTSFSDAAAVLDTEKFGLAFFWRKQETVEDFIGLVLDHIEGSLALDPFTGKFRFKLIRDDYNVEDLPVFDPSNAIFEDYQRKAWGEAINEVTVSWTSPITEQAETVTVHDTAGISVQGGAIISETRDYFGIRTADLALRAASRDLRAGSALLATASMRINRKGWRLLPGDVIVVNWPAYGIETLPMRIMDVDYGRPGDSELTLSLLEDVFALPQQSYAVSDGTAWVDPAIPPEPLQYEHLTSVFFYPVAQRLGASTAATIPSTADYDMGFGTHASINFHSFDMMVQETDANGVLSWVRKDNVPLACRATLAEAIEPEVTTVLSGLNSTIHGESLAEGVLLWVGPIDQTGEMVLVKTIDGNGYTLTRGVLDTVPASWPVDTPVWVIHGTHLAATGIERAVGGSATVRYLPLSNDGRLDVTAAADVTATMSGRLHLPYRPAAFAVDGQLFPAEPPIEPVTLTWAERSRLEEDTVIHAWDGASVTPEAGTTYTIEMDALDGAGALIQANWHVETGLTGTSFAFDSISYPPPSGTASVVFRLYSVRDGLQSWQAATQQAALFQPAYNLNAIFIPD